MTQPHEDDLDRGANRQMIEMCISIISDFLQLKKTATSSGVLGVAHPGSNDRNYHRAVV